MENERRRYFRIDETIGIAYHALVDGEAGAQPEPAEAHDVLSLVSKQDEQIERLLLEVENTHPQVAALVLAFNQKLERVVRQLMLESNLVERLAHKVREVNLSACGIAFVNDEAVPVDTRLKLELSLMPSPEVIETYGIVVGCDPQHNGRHWYWRVDFFGMDDATQEKLIQHIVQSQSQQLKTKLKR